ncbi:MAG TPA: hypothetical protein VGE34_01495 [Candidatus Saccharimonadales bacterium]
MNEVIGVIGANGDLGSQLVRRLEDANFNVLPHDTNVEKSNRALREIKASATVIHLTIPATALPEYGKFCQDANGIAILHDSVMHTSNAANDAYFAGNASVVHMLMNEEDKVVVAERTANEDEVIKHVAEIGMNPVVMPACKHDEIMAMSQAPLALLCEMVHLPLQQYLADGLLTPSGKELANALSARTATWTDATVGSLLQNPYLHKLVRDMRDALNEVTPNVSHDSDIKEKLKQMGIVNIPDSPMAAQILFNKTNRNRLRMAIQSEPDDNERSKMIKHAREHYPLPGDDAFETI